MKRRICLLGGLLCLFFVFCYIFLQNGSDGEGNASQEVQIEKIASDDVSDEMLLNEMSPEETLSDETLSGETLSNETLPDKSSSEEETKLRDDEKRAYVKAYTDFLLYENIDQGHDFPIRGYYLFDLNFDNIPELGILHDSWGSMGGYFTFYCFDGNSVTAVLNDRGDPARVSNYTQVLADFEQKKVYLLKEMYLLQGNDNGTYGYLREIKSEGQVPCVYDILNLEVDQGSDLKSHFGTQYEGEDDFLSDPALEDCLITQRYLEKVWIDISSNEYLKQKRELIPQENSFVDLREGDLHYLGANYDEDGGLLYTDVRMGEEEIEQLFTRFAQSIE